METPGHRNRRTGGKKRRRKEKKKEHSWKSEETLQNDIQIDTHHYTILENANSPYINTGIASGCKKTELVEFFMTESASADRPSLSQDFVTAFCRGDITQQSEHGAFPQYEESVDALYQLMEGFRNIPTSHVALVDYWTRWGKAKPTFLPSGPLGAQEIRSMLQQISEDATHMVKQEMASERDQRGRRPHYQHSSRLVVFITDLNKWSTAAIISTATINQAKGLRQSLYRHLALKSFIGEIPPAYKCPNFELAFDLPYYAFRTTPRDQKPKDDRQSGGNGPLREVTDLSYLLRSIDASNPPEEIDCICEAQMSLLITGAEESKWTAYFFADTYFENDGAGESAENYEEERNANAGDIHIDPLTGGQSDVPAADLTAWEYFLIVIEARLGQYTDEWKILVNSMKAKIEAYVNECPVTALDISYSPNSQDLSSVGKSYKSIIQAMRHVDEMAYKLNSTLDEWHSWSSGRIYARVPERAAHLLPSIEFRFRELKRCSGDLGYIRDTCKKYEEKLTFHLNHNGNMNAKAQNDLTLATSIIMVGAATPVALAAAILSMQPPAIPPPLGVNSKSFFALIGVFGSLIWVPFLVFRVSKYIPSIKRFLLVLLKQEQMDEEAREAAQRP